MEGGRGLTERMATLVREDRQVNDVKPVRTDLTTVAWREIEKASFAVIGYTTPTGEPRSSGVVYATVGRRLYIAVAPESWKARHIGATGRISATVLVRKGGILTLLFPIPPATISFSATAVVHQPGSLDLKALAGKLAALIPPDTVDRAAVIEVTPQGEFLTYGIGIPLMQMRDQARARGRAPVAG
jgi:hypothetical protein